MHHIKPTSKGDPLCPLGFHPQVRWPTRCKRCFRDYKEHGNRNKDQDIQLRRDELTVSTPALSSYSSSRLREDNIPGNTIGTRTWTSSSNLSSTSSSIKKPIEEAVSSASSWTSSPNLAEQKDDNIVVSFTLPKRKSREPEPIKEEEDYRRTQYTVRRRTSTGSNAPTPSNESPRSSIISTPSTRSSPYRSVPQTETTPQSNAEVDFIFHVKSSNKNQSSTTQGRDVTKPFSKEKSPKKGSDEGSSDDESVANTETTETTIINPHEQQLQEEIDNLKRELEIVKVRCERAEREKSDILLRRLASMETTTSKTTASEVLKLQQKCNELRTTVEDLRDEKKVLSLRVRELEADLEISKKQSTQKETEQLRSKLQAAETLCEELMEENEDMKRELKNMEEEMIEMHDNFREDQADEYSSMKKELEQTTKNCRILSFKLRKAERKAEQLDAEKLEAERKLREIAGGQAGLDKAERIRQLEHDLSVANEAASRLQKELEEAKSKTKKNDKDQPVVKKKAPMLGSLPKTPSGERMSRESLTRGGSQEDPVQLLRDLQDSLEREADLREQLRQAEDEAQNLRKKASRVEDDNESLVLQLKKMATKARTRRHSPSPQRLTPEPVEKDEGISDEEDPAELRILLELNEQEAAVLRRKVEDLESESDGLKKKVKDLQDKLAIKETPAKKSILKNPAEPVKANAIYEQKMKVLEEEMSDLRKKLIEKDRECERLHTELSLGVKKPKVLQKSRSLDGDQQTVDLKRQLQVIETEANVLRTRIQNLETENEKLQAENKKLSLVKATKRASSVERGSEEEKSKIAILEKQLEESKSKIKELEKTSGGTKNTTVPVGEIEKLKAQLKKVETEKKKFEESLKRVKDDAFEDIINYYHKRTPKTPTDMTTKLQMKKMVEEVESELGELLAILKKSENEKKSLAQGNKNEVETKKLKEELEASKKKLETLEKELKEQETKKQSEVETLSNSSKKLEEEKVKYKKEVDKLKQQLEKEKQKLMESKNEMEQSKKSSSTEVDKLKEEIKKAKGGQEEASILKKKLETATVELQEQKRLIEELNKKLEETNKDGAEKKKLLDQVEDKENAYMEMEKKAKDFEEKLKKSEKLLHMKKEKVTKLEKEKEEINGKVSELEKDKLALAEDQRELTRRFNEAEQKIEELKKELTNKTAEMKKLEKSKKKDMDNVGKTTSNEIAQLQGDLKTAKTKIQELTDQIAKAEKEYSSTKETMKSKEKELEKEVETWEKKASELEMDLQAERKMMERLKGTQEKEIKAKDLEIAQLRAKTHTAGAKKLSELKQEMQAKIDKLELAVASEKHEYDELTSKYEQLEEEHVITKAQLVKDKEKLHSQLLTSQRDFVEVEAELKALRETFNTKQDTWIIEKLNMQEKLKENENHIEKWQLEKTRLQAICDERQSELEQVRKESQGLNEQNDLMRKENEELRKQIEDFEKVSKIQRNMNADVSALEKQVKEYKVKLTNEEKARKGDISSMKLRYENQVSVISDELLNTQKQMARFKKERDSYRHMMEAAQKTISELKSAGSHINQANRNSYEGDELKDHIAALEQQVSCLEDELSESRVEASQLRTELVSERSAWEVKVSELSSRLNELEEEKILSSGRTKISGLKTKMELAWQKEREEQHRLLQETSTLARDLRQTLFEVERERDKERLEARRKLEQQKRGSEEEQEEIRKKLNDMHCDLLELRDAHAKLRTTNEKLRREKEKMDKDREMLRQSLAMKKKMEQEEERRIIGVAQLVEELTVLAPDLFPSKPKLPAGMPTPPVRRKGPKSREASPLLERKDYSRESSVGRDDIKSQEVQEILVRLTEAANQLRKYQLSDREAARAAFASRRAASTESDRGSEPATRREHGKQKSLLRKSLSLEQTSAQEQMMIWKMEDDKDGSLPSIQSLDDMDQYQLIHRRDPSLDSRLSGGSTRSEVLPTEKKKKTSLFGKLKKLTKSSRSMDQSLDMGSDAGSSGALDRGSDSSLNAVDEKAGRHFKLSGMFKKSGSTSRGNSLERNLKPPTGLPMDSTQRPLVNSSVASNAESSSSSRSASKKPPSSAPIQRKMKK